MGLVLKHVQEPTASRHYYRYRRRVPDDLKPYVSKGEFVFSLGGSRDEALKHYAGIHRSVERELEMARKAKVRDLAKRDPVTLTDRDRYNMVIERLAELGIENPFDPATNEDETMQREIIAEGIASRYPVDPDDDHPIISNPIDVMLIQTLMGKAPAKPAPTFDDAVKLYVRDKLSGATFEVKKKKQRVERVTERFKLALGRNPQLNKISREDAQTVKNHLLNLGTLVPASVKRELNIVKAIINHAIIELELVNCNNPFKNLPIEGLEDEDVLENRDTIPQDILVKIRARIFATCNAELSLIWRLLEGTGCRLAEVSGLRVQDVVVDGELPHIKVINHENRRLKSKASKRMVPLIGDTLEAANAAVELAGDGQMLFPTYGNSNGPTNVSQMLMNRVRDVTDDDKIVVHSLRHDMKDRLQLCGADDLQQCLVLGHTLRGAGNKSYGSSRVRLIVATEVMKKAYGLVTA